MKLSTFQTRARDQRLNDPTTLDFTVLRLVEEAGEVAGVTKRISRRNQVDGFGVTNPVQWSRLKDEMGDVLHSLSKAADAAGLSLEEIAVEALKKQDRKSA